MGDSNRRESFRHRFGFLLRPKAELLHAGEPPEPPHIGVLLNLSMDGTAILLPEEIAESRWSENWLHRFTLKDRRGKPLPLVFGCRIMHGYASGEGHVRGLQFISTGTASFELGRRVVWSYLLEQQARFCSDSSA